MAIHYHSTDGLSDIQDSRDSERDGVTGARKDEDTTRFPTQPHLANKPRAKIARKSSTRRDKVQVFTEADLTVHAALGELQAVSSQTFNTVHYS